MTDKKVETEELVKIIQKIDKLAVAGDFRGIDRILLCLPYKNEPAAFVITCIRTTYPFRDKLVWWETLVRDYAAHLDKIGKDKKRVLIGLERFYE
jgi:hypothetical protein